LGYSWLGCWPVKDELEEVWNLFESLSEFLITQRMWKTLKNGRGVKSNQKFSGPRLNLGKCLFCLLPPIVRFYDESNDESIKTKLTKIPILDGRVKRIPSITPKMRMSLDP